MERQLEKLKERVEKKNSRTNRVRKEIFGEEEDYITSKRME